ncbi:hypothetical protein IMCC9480_362 [Oxalobacteraceae bacterium IMCC9480]|nr:hypothetical protein IMCC9480_362 [Oxalobacteraceae bacterium IMCC9480]
MWQTDRDLRNGVSAGNIILARSKPTTRCSRVAKSKMPSPSSIAARQKSASRSMPGGAEKTWGLWA